MWPALALVFVAFACLAQVALRSGLVLRGPVSERAAAWGDRLGVSVQIASIRPVGFWGVRLAGVALADASDGAAMVDVESVDVFAEPTALLRGELVLRQVVVNEPRVTLVLGDELPAPMRWVRDRAVGGVRDAEASADAAAPRVLPQVLLVGGQLDVHDENGLFPGFAARVEELVARPSAAEVGRTELQGLVDIAGLGRVIVQGAAGGGAPPRIVLRALEDNDVFAMLPAHWRPSTRSSLNIGAATVLWPPAVELGPASMRDLDIELPGLEGWRLRTVYADQLALQFSRAGVGVRLSTARVELTGLLASTELHVSALDAFRAWDGSMSIEATLQDGEGGTLEVEASAAAGEERAAILHGESYRFAALARLLPVTVPVRPLRGAMSGTVELRQERVDAPLLANGSLQVRDAALRAPLMASQVLEDIDLDAQIDVWARPAAGEWRFPAVTLRSDGVEARVVGSMVLGRDRTQLELAARVPTVDANRVLQALPRGFAPVLAGFELRGSAAFSASLRVDTAAIERSEIAFAIEDHGVEVVRFGSQAPVDRLAGEDFAWTVATFEGERRDVGPGTASWVSLTQVAEALHRSVLAAEDDGFYQHGGFDWRGIHAALLMNLEAGGVVRGGSTISQQVAKNLFLNHDRTVARKLQEAFLTWLLERYVPKRRILEAYINLAHWGPGVYGIGEASMTYFRHVPQNLTVRESIFLAAILPNPALFGEQYAQRVIAPSRQQKMRNIVNNLQRSGFLTAAEAANHLAMLDRGVVSASPRPDFSARLGPSSAQPGVASPESVAGP